MANIIELKNISKSFDDLTVLDNISLNVSDGEFLTLLGPSGCGKTTLLRLLSGFEHADQGEIYIANKEVSKLVPQRRDVHTVFQSYALFPHMNVFDNVAFGLRCKHLSETVINDEVMAALRMVKLEDLIQRKPDQLSGGQQQRVAIARAVVNKPLVLLLDEPLSSLDYHLRKSMQLELKQLQRKLGITFIFVTHDQEEALSMSDRIAVLHGGKIEQIGTPREIYEKPINFKVAKFIGALNIFDTTVLSATEQKVEVEIDNVKVFVNNTRRFVAGDKICVLIRPEDLRVWDTREVDKYDLENALPGKVEEIIYKGSTVDLIVALDSGQRIAATEFFDEDDEKLEYQINEKVWVSWLPGWEVLLPYEAH